MRLFSGENLSNYSRATGNFGKITLIVFATMIWGCSPVLQKTAISPAENPPEIDSSDTFADFIKNDQSSSLQKITEGALKQEIDSVLEPLSREDIPLPSPAESISLENDNSISNPALGKNRPEIAYDFPVIINSHVEFFLDKFQNSQHKTFRIWLERSGRYVPMIQEELRKAGMPLDLAYLPMIESGYRLTAYSKARAVGPWQFMRATGRSYELDIDNYVDERRDPVKSTKAAINFLADLHAEFNSWQLAVAAYNAGSGRVRQAIRQKGSNDFWQLIKGTTLRKETKYYVPKLIAAIIIAKDPESYGFYNIEYDEPLTFETLDVPRWIAMQAVALAGDTPLEDIRNLNRHLRREITPPGKGSYSIRVPAEKKELIAKNLPRVKASISTGYKTHVIRKGDTVTRICNRYNINMKTLLKANNLRSNVLVAGRRLRIPYRTTSYRLLDEGMMTAGLAPAEMLPENLIIHKIKPGETVSELAKRYNVPPQMIAAWNGLEDLGRIRAGQQLAFYLQASDKMTAIDIAATDKIATSPTEQSNTSGKPRPTYYHVIGGDTLWEIAKKFQTTPEKIKRWNNLEGNRIYPGHRLLLKTDDDIDV
jgi:membrane-bound lytic murein transglycosylase D